MANFFKGILGAGLGFLTGGPAGAFAGGVAGLGDQSGQQQSQASQLTAYQQAALQQQMAQAQQIAANQQQLYASAAPAYGPIVNQLLANAGIGGYGGAYGSPMYLAPGAQNGVSALTPGSPAGAPNYYAAYQAQGGGAPGYMGGPGGTQPVAVPTFDANGGQSTGYNGIATTAGPMVTNPHVNGGQPFRGTPWRLNAPGTKVVMPAGTPVAPIVANGQRPPGYFGPMSTTPGQTTYYPNGYGQPGTKADGTPQTPGAPGTQGPVNYSSSSAPGVPDYMLGVYNLPQQQLQFQAANEDINRATNANANQLRFNLGVAGAGANTIAAALARNQQAGMESEAAFRRNLAINAPELQQQRTMQAFSALEPGLSAGTNGTAANIYGNAASQYGQAGQYQQGLANQSASQVGQTIGNFAQNRSLQNYLGGNGGGGNSGGTPSDVSGTGGTYGVDQSPNVTPADTASFGGGLATGGPVSPGHYYEVGEHGPEVLYSPQPGTVIPNYAAQMMGMLPPGTAGAPVHPFYSYLQSVARQRGV